MLSHKTHPKTAILAALVTAFLAGDYFHAIHLCSVAIVKTSLAVATVASEKETPPHEAKHTRTHKAPPQLALRDLGGAK
jgi:hypothetical protein